MSVAANKELRNLNCNRKGLDQAFLEHASGKNIETLEWRVLRHTVTGGPFKNQLRECLKNYM